MIQNIAFLISFLILSVFSFQPDQPIKVTMDVPSEVQAGNEMTVTLNIKKGEIESFSRFTQSLPYGLTAERVTTANADFSFEEQRLRIIWLKLPPDDSLRVKYKIKVDPKLTGSFNLDGEFAFVEENQRRTMEVDPGHIISIIPNPEIAENEKIDIDEYQELAMKELAGRVNTMSVIRSEPIKSGAFEYTIKLKINKGDLSKFAKVEEYIPDGYRVVEGESSEGIFSVNQGVVKILWMNLPEEDEFTVSYRIVPDPGQSIEDLDINGSFSYITGNETKTVTIYDAGDVYLAQEAEDSTEITTPVVETDVGDSTENEADIEEVVAEEPVEEETGLLEEETAVQPPVLVPSVTEKKETTEQSFMLNPEQGIYYRVQLAAGHQKINIDRYFVKLNVQDEVKMEFHEGWRKYTTGSFYVYKDARDYRVKIWDSTPINGAFVSAYNNGDRITVQEALMVSNQKWYR